MAKANENYRTLTKSCAKAADAWFDATADKIAASALMKIAAVAGPPGLGIHPDQAEQRMDEWLAPMIATAYRIGAEGARAALVGLFESDLPSALAALSRSHKGGAARSKVRDPKGARRSEWGIQIIQQVFRDRHFMKKLSDGPETPESDAIIERAINLRIIDSATRTGDPASAYYMDYESGRQIARDTRAMRAALSRLKAKWLKEKSR